MAIATIIISIAIGFATGVWWQRSRTPDQQAAARAAVHQRKEAEKARIMALFDTKSPSASSGQVDIANDDVQALLQVSDATATNLLTELESEGRITQVGTLGRPVHYQKKA